MREVGLQFGDRVMLDGFSYDFCQGDRICLAGCVRKIADDTILYMTYKRTYMFDNLATIKRKWGGKDYIYKVNYW